MLCVIEQELIIPPEVSINLEVDAVEYEGRFLIAESGCYIITEDDKLINLYRNGRN